MSESDDPVIMFFAAVGDQLEDAVHNVKACRIEAAVDALEKAVKAK